MFQMTSRIAFRSAAIAGITSALLLALVSTGAHAGTPKNPFPVDCKFDGTFFPPTSPGAGGVGTSDVLSTALGECKGLGHVNLTGILEVDGLTFNVLTGCADVESIGNDMIVFNKKGDSLNYEVSGQQCLRTAANTPSPGGTFCGTAPTDPHTSDVSANFNVLGGTGLLAAATGGGGTLTGTVNHCAAAFPFGNSFKGTMSGSVNVP